LLIPDPTNRKRFYIPYRLCSNWQATFVGTFTTSRDFITGNCNGLPIKIKFEYALTTRLYETKDLAVIEIKMNQYSRN